MISPKDLSKVWDAPDNSTLTKKQFSLRLPILAAAKIEAICEMYPRKSKNEIIADLISTALEQYEQGLPSVNGRLLGDHPDYGRIYEDVGPASRFRELTGKHLRELEKECGAKTPIEWDTSAKVIENDLEEN